MKKYTRSLKAKVIAFVILIVLIFFAVISFMGICYGMKTNIYYGVDSYYDSYIFRNKAEQVGYRALGTYIMTEQNDFDYDQFEYMYSRDESNLRFSISKKETPDVFEYSNYVEGEDIEYYAIREIEDLIITINAVNPITADDDFYLDYQIFNFVYSFSNIFFLVLGLSIILIILDLIFLCNAAGHRGDTEEIHLNFLDKIAFDILIIGEILGFYLLFKEIYENLNFNYFIDYVILVIALMFLVTVMLVTVLSFSVRKKKGILIKQLFITRIFSSFIKNIKTARTSTLKFFRMLPYIWQGALTTLIIILLNSFLYIRLFTSYYYWFFLLALIILNIVLFIGICFALSQMNQLRNFSKELADGLIESKLNTDKMYFHFKEHGENLNKVSNGINIAIEERMKSEHLKTELITNVSHDIKTPLTSIINYVGLIKQEDIDNENAKKYINVVDKQSIRLKKLLEDLMDVSKASTGNITVENTPCELNVLLGQVVGEYKEKLEKEGLELIISEVDEPLVILGDGRHLWRIFDNLLNNICKYAQEKTRVYLSLEKQDDKAVITFRNISSYPLNITSEELMERFVRGDRSRHTEGSGLGLSIAKSLTDLQNGTMDIVIDGDLFKVILSFNIALYSE